MRLHRHKLLAGLTIGALLAIGIAGVAGARMSHWRHLRRVTVTVVNGSLPPPYGKPHTRRFRTRQQLVRVTRALNANHIAGRAARASDDCTGGYDVRLTIVPAHGARTRLTAYRCGDTTFGQIAGNVPRFLTAIGLAAS
ncbi:MAG: hypothetical protein ACRDNJ_08445 [Solirubrobacteraceae bacterium]